MDSGKVCVSVKKVSALINYVSIDAVISPEYLNIGHLGFLLDWRSNQIY